MLERSQLAAVRPCYDADGSGCSEDRQPGGVGPEHRSNAKAREHAKKWTLTSTRPGSNRKYGKMYHFIYLLRNTKNANVLYKAPNLQRLSPDVLDY